MKIILTNDDGIEAPGLQALAAAAADLGELIVVAPERQFSGCGHQVTTHAPITLREAGRGRFAVDGTPVDCTRLALLDLIPEAALILAGINGGGNLGVDVFISGTVAAAREAIILGVPAIAVSQYCRKGQPVDWERSTRWTRDVLRRVLERREPPARTEPAARIAPRNGDQEIPALWNINLPHLPAGDPDPAVVFCALDTSPLPVAFQRGGEAPIPATAIQEFTYSGDYASRPRVPGRDVDICLGGRIAVTALAL